MADFTGADERNRTADLLITNRYQGRAESTISRSYTAKIRQITPIRCIVSAQLAVLLLAACSTTAGPSQEPVVHDALTRPGLVAWCDGLACWDAAGRRVTTWQDAIAAELEGAGR